jgi:3-methyladenine DNA glycosylase/8-oxoguanine DNA glycosylase
VEAAQLEDTDEQFMAELTTIAEKWRRYRRLATSYLFSATFEGTGTPTPSTSTRRTNHGRTPSPDADAH